MFEKYQGNLVLRELQYKNNQISKAGEVILYGATNGSMVFSPDGNYLAVLTKKQDPASSQNLYICHGQEIIANFKSYNLQRKRLDEREMLRSLSVQGEMIEDCNIKLK